MGDIQWKFLNFADNKLRSFKDWNCEWTVGEWKETLEEPVIGKTGYHSAPTIPEALCMKASLVLAQVECGGKHMESDNQSVWQKMKIIKAWNITLDVLDRFYLLAVTREIEQHPEYEMKQEMLRGIKGGVSRIEPNWVSTYKNNWYLHINTLRYDPAINNTALRIASPANDLQKIWTEELLPTLTEFNPREAL